MPRPSRRTFLGVGIPLVVVIVLLAAWGIDTGGSGGRVIRNVSIGGRGVGGLKEDRVGLVVHRAALDFAKTPVEIRTAAKTYRSTAGEIGLSIDEPGTVTAVLAEGRSDPLLTRPLQWLASFAKARAVRPRYKVRSDQLALVLIALEGQAGRLPVEPTIVGSPASVSVRAGTNGRSLDPTTIGRGLVSAAEEGRDPIAVSTEPVEHHPRGSDAGAGTLASILTIETSHPLRVVAGKTATSVPGPTVRGWLGAKVSGAKLLPTVDQAHVVRDLRALLTGLSGKATDAKITLDGSTPKIVPGKEGTTCCGAGAAAAVLKALESNAPSVRVPVTVTHPAFSTAEATKLGIKEPVGTTTTWAGQPQVKSFTTYYQAGQPRVANIHRIADLVRGAIVKPGGTFSVDDYVGKRTTAKGFVVAGAIADGEEADEVGGGVSQFATTLFNAAFFAGLDFGEYQSHSIHFDRYPIGREATMGYPHPDLQIRNTTPYGLLIGTSYTATSVTVTFYSTQWVSGQQTAQASTPQGNCTRVTTTRTRAYADGHTATDKVFAVYRPDYGINC